MDDVFRLESIDDISELVKYTKVFINGDWMFITDKSKDVYEKLIIFKKEWFNQYLCINII